MDKTPKGNPQVIIIIISIVVVISAIFYYLYITGLRSRECTFMNNIYGTLNTRIKPINASSAQCKFNLQDYYIKTAYNCCSGGSYKNDYVDTCNLINVLKQGCRGLDFEIYSIDDNPVVSTSILDNNYVKETYNYVEFSEVMNILKNYAFSASTAPNYTDPLIIHLRIKSNNSKMIANFADLFKQYSGLMVGETYSYENHGNNIGAVPLLTFMTSPTSSRNNIILIVDRQNKMFLENQQFMEYVNMTSNSIFMRGLRYYDIKYAQDIVELQEFNKLNLSIGMPDLEVNPVNPNGIVVRESGCQMIAMRYQYVDNYLEENIGFFDKVGFAFALKPERLRYIPVELPDPTPQNPELSYESRNVSSDYFSFNI
jgi:Phosphatidylinositol-specific phospholipase C, X domain